MKRRKSTTKQAAQQYDITVKELLQAAPPKLLQLLMGKQPVEILTVEFPKVRVRRPDFVVRTTDENIQQLEVQSDNDDDMEWRMLDYYPLLRKLFGRPPIQRVLYIGQKPLKMAGRIDEPNLQFCYEVIDLREVDANILLKSKSVEDRIMAILCHADNEQRKIRRILQSLTPFPAKIQGDKIEQLLVLSRLRGLTDMVTQEVQRKNLLREIVADSPFLTKLVNDRVAKRVAEQLAELANERVGKLANERASKLANERAEKLAERRIEQRVGKVRKELEKNAINLAREETRKVLTRQLEVLHGKLPQWAKEKIAAANTRTLEKWAVRLLKAKTLEEALR